MATLTRTTSPANDEEVFAPADEARPLAPWSGWRKTLTWLASLKLTVTLFALSLVIVFVGTLAQDEENLVSVKRNYFNAWISYVPIDVFAPVTVFQHDRPYGLIDLKDKQFQIGFPFPGGALLGGLLMVNLIAAKLVRFKVSAHGGRLGIGVVVLTAGSALMTAICVAGHAGEGLQGQPLLSYDVLWNMVRITMVVGSVVSAWAALSPLVPIRNLRVTHPLLRSVCGFVSATLLALTIVVYTLPTARIDDSGLRILWQLLNCGFASIAILAGCVLVFGPRGGNVLVHVGVALLMLSQFIFGDKQLEQQLTLREGEVTNQLRQIDEVELAFIDRSDASQDEVTVIPESMLLNAVGADRPIRDDRLPFAIVVKEFHSNSTLARIKSDGGETPAFTHGLLKGYRIVPQADWGGASSRRNVASAVIELRDKRSGNVVGTYGVSPFLSDFSSIDSSGQAADEYDSVPIDAGKSVEMGLRWKRITKPYWIKLNDVRRLDYANSNTPRDYSSMIEVFDSETGEKLPEQRVWMNNPLRFRGETFYQSSYEPLRSGKERTTLQVVINAGWMVPYASCMMVLVGLTSHFMGTLMRFLGRRARASGNAALPRRAVVMGLGIAALFVGTAALRIFPWSSLRKGPSAKITDKFDFYRAGAIPVSHGGRIMPLDAYARQTLKGISNREALDIGPAGRSQFTKIFERATGSGKEIKAIEWLFMLASNDPEIFDLRMIRIDHTNILSQLKVAPFESHQYALRTLEQDEAWKEHVRKLREKADEAPLKLTVEDKKWLELDNRYSLYMSTWLSFGAIPFPTIPPIDELQNPESKAVQEFVQRKNALDERAAFVDGNSSLVGLLPRPKGSEPPRGPMQGNAGTSWRPFYPALHAAQIDLLLQKEDAVDPLVIQFSKMIDAYRAKDFAAFNTALDEYFAAFHSKAPAEYQPRLVGLDRWLQIAAPVGTSAVLYWSAAVLCLLGYIFATGTLHHAARWILLGAVLMHTAALVARVVVTGRPPVINLYSSAVFIGWAVVAFSLILDRLYRNGLPLIVAGITGGLAAMVAWSLDTDDTMGVLQAVLDTQFWLTTHVITVTLGYAATFLAGFFAVAQLVFQSLPAPKSELGKAKRKQEVRELYGICYGIICFAILFSFIGTVLGGLWADDSWGRFWGWDPKENGALMIVIWNALVLHARWDAWVRERGFAILAVVGNVVTAWSWFGTNQLGIGLHSYGFTEGVLLTLTGFVALQFLIVVAALVVAKPLQKISA
jgi:ABC-type transport system involved in cytochrome c biogenesis permease subunit